MTKLNTVRRKWLKALAALGACWALPSVQLLQSEHPRISVLRSQVLGMPVSEVYKAALLRSIVTYQDQITSRPEHEPDQGLNDLVAIQQVTLSDEMERWLGALTGGNNVVLGRYVPFG